MGIQTDNLLGNFALVQCSSTSFFSLGGVISAIRVHSKQKVLVKLTRLATKEYPDNYFWIDLKYVIILGNPEEKPLIKTLYFYG